MNRMKRERIKRMFAYIGAGKTGRALCAAAAGTAAAVLLALPALAYSGSGVVNVASSLRVRSAASANAAVLGRLYDGAKISIVGSSSGWYQISYGGKTAWVSSSYVLTGAAAGRHQVVAAAEWALGSPYVFGGASLSGFDCSGLALFAYQKAGITLPHSAAKQATMGTAVSRANLQPGDLIFFDTEGGGVSHEGVYIGNGMFIQAESGTVQKVVETSLSNSYWSRVYVTARRFIN